MQAAVPVGEGAMAALLGASFSVAEQVAEATKRAAGEAGSEFRAAASETVDKLRKTGEDAVRAVKETADAGREF